LRKLREHKDQAIMAATQLLEEREQRVKEMEEDNERTFE